MDLMKFYMWECVLKFIYITFQRQFLNNAYLIWLYENSLCFKRKFSQSSCIILCIICMYVIIHVQNNTRISLKDSSINLSLKRCGACFFESFGTYMYNISYVFYMQTNYAFGLNLHFLSISNNLSTHRAVELKHVFSIFF